MYPCWMNSAKRAYHPLSVLIHWAVVALVLVCLVTIAVATRLPRVDALRAVLIKSHVISGQLLFLFNLIRLSIFSAFGTPAPVGQDFHQVHAMRFMHALLYGAVGFLACSGTLLAISYAAGQTVFGLHVPLILSPMGMAALRDLHNLVSMAFVFFCLIHAAASLAMHYFAGRTTLARMRVDSALTDYITPPETEKNYLRLDAPVFPAEPPAGS